MNFPNTLFGPLAKDYCSLFLFLSVLGLFYVVLAIFGFIALLFYKKASPQYAIHLVTFLAVGLIAYVQNRLLYNMCLR